MTALGPEALEFVRDRVIHVVGHELRTPLTTVRGLAELLVDAPDEELHETLIPALIRNARRAERLLDDLLIAAEIHTARPTDPAAPVDLGALVADSTADTPIAVEGAPAGSALAHRDAVAHALDHLVDNAEQYGDAPSTVRFEDDEGSVTVVVETPVDHELADLQLSFELFFRGEQAVTRAAGLGIGLPVARALAQMDGGDLTIGQDGDTVVARLTLPRAR
ncbi:HAMP domain-containing histidine kinase [Acidimicrobiia bacterium EGI L10123]|uniref:sensor histidine kinase n=1 Tax=Salinilacustrithrix flava TaxID=2957203 RepID=UPI003D7C2C49|nr:HAMP domain-containing histidine kinase [Acidimicrobiia bacterium EGI L10123]